MKRSLKLVPWVAAGISILGLTTAGSATAKSTQGMDARPAPAHVINLHKAYEARLGHTTQGPISGVVYTLGTNLSRGRGGNGCAEPDCAVSYHGGSVQHTPHVYLLLWGPNWESDPSQASSAQYLESFYQGLGVQPQDDWSTTTEQYSDETGSPTFSGSVYAGAFEDTTTPPTGVDQSQLGAEADAFASRQGITDLNDAQIVIATQSGTCPAGFAGSSCGGSGYYCAWHSYSNEPYTNLPYQLDAGDKCGEDFVNHNSGTYDGFSIIGGHEYAETITDPFPNTGWVDPDDLGGGEIADKCIWSSQSSDVPLQTGSFAMQPLWSNSAYAINPANGCVMSTVTKGDITVQSPGNQSTYHSVKLTLQAIGTSSNGSPLTWSATGLPPELKIDTSSGLISGRVKAPRGSYHVMISAMDATGTVTVSFIWTVTADVGSLVSNTGSRLCLNDLNWVTTPGNEIVMWKCIKDIGNEMFSHRKNGELVVFGQCLTDPHNHGTDQIQQIYPCAATANQVWSHNSKHEYVLKRNGLCLTDPDSSKQNGTPAVIKKCANTNSQHWIGS